MAGARGQTARRHAHPGGISVSTGGPASGRPSATSPTPARSPSALGARPELRDDDRDWSCCARPRRPQHPALARACGTSRPGRPRRSRCRRGPHRLVDAAGLRAAGRPRRRPERRGGPAASVARSGSSLRIRPVEAPAGRGGAGRPGGWALARRRPPPRRRPSAAGRRHRRASRALTRTQRQSPRRSLSARGPWLSRHRRRRTALGTRGDLFSHLARALGPAANSRATRVWGRPRRLRGESQCSPSVLEAMTLPTARHSDHHPAQPQRERDEHS